MDLSNYRIPKHLDDPPMFLMFEADTAGIFLIFLLGGFMLHSPIPVLLGFVLARMYARLKQDGGRGVLAQSLYWYTPSTSNPNGKIKIQSCNREYIG